MKLAPYWFRILASEARRVAKERGLNYDTALVKEAAVLHAEAERRLGNDLRRPLRDELRRVLRHVHPSTKEAENIRGVIQALTAGIGD